MQTNLDFLTLHTRDLAAARRFFTEVLGSLANDASGEVRPTGLSSRSNARTGPVWQSGRCRS
ncbi:VOC family protein [Deinococcus sp.]|uniref:VOC family protein n=1 Tax=Deinococcus sp. TaxID=47478 RepID=UPI003C7C7F68